MKYEIHPAANAFPMMDEKRYVELVADIRAHGQRVPCVLCSDNGVLRLLDGRNRAKACEVLGIEPLTEIYSGNPWSYVWSMNGTRRDLVADQRYLIWKFVNENSEGWQNEKRRIAEQANAKRAEATKAQPRTDDGKRLAEGQVVQHSVALPADKHKSQSTAAKLSNTNAGAVARGDKLAKVRPDLAEKVRMGSVKPADAYRQMKRDEIVESLESVAAVEAKKASGVYDVIVIDPPWPMGKIERDERPNQVAFDYPTMTEDEIAKIEIPHADNCHVWLWATHKFLPMAFRLLDAWGMKYVCTFVWHKSGGFQPIGLPQFNCEFALYARIGTPKFIDTKAFNTCFIAARGRHSEKPESFYEMTRRVTAGRRLDMFNRRRIEGFDGWGKESPE